MSIQAIWREEKKYILLPIVTYCLFIFMTTNSNYFIVKSISNLF